MFRYTYIAVLWIFLMGSFLQLKAQSAKEIIDKMLWSISQTKTATYSSVLTERINGELQTAENKIKLNINPFKSYIFLPNTGVEVLYIRGKNQNKALVNPNKFPFVNLKLDIQSSILRNKQHHTIEDLGFSYFGDVLRHDMQKAGASFESRVSYKGTKQWESYDCYVISIENPDFSYNNYLLKPDENLLLIAKKMKLSEYMLLELNKELGDYYSFKPGYNIKVPNYYSKKSIIYIDKKTYLPVLKAIFDDKGLFEKYEYKNLIKNPALSEEDFSSENKNYGF